jgi:peroxin-19
VHQLACS